MNIVYNASAGTGKTYQVTQLYEELVLHEQVDPREILLMTFTENAAAELRMRVSQRLLKARRLAELDGNNEQAEQAISAISHLPSAPIGTIHSFCTRLLREHALEAGLSPSFSVLVGDEHDALLNQISREELLKQLDTDPDFNTFCSGAHIIGTGGGFGSSITETVPKLIGQAGSLGISLESAESMLPDPIAAGSLPNFSILLERLHELPKPTASAQLVIQSLEEHLPNVKTVEELANHLNKAKLVKFGRGKGHKPISDDFWDLLNAVNDSVKYKERFPAAKAFARYVQTVVTQFQQRKHQMDAVDFDDQLHMASALLQSKKAAPEFKYVIVDEVQDTSRIQCQLIQSLWGPDTNLIICGDKKQSIYTWRGADPQVMPDLEAEILARENSRLENLQTSYRSKKPVLDVVNALFSKVYDEATYAAGDRLSPNPDFATPDEKPCAEFLQPDYEDDLQKQGKISEEMDAIANRIQLLVGGAKKWQPNFRYSDTFQQTTDSNAYRYSDILILLRRTTHQSTLEHALRHAGIPYTLGGKGRGLFTRQETRDVSLFLNVITNSDDAYSLIGFLRSPWIGLSDETIAELAYTEDGFSIDHLKSHFSDMGVPPMKHGQDARATILQYRELTGTKLVSELVRMLIEETSYDALLAGLPRGTQRLANLRKVLDWIRETERGAQTTPAMVARQLAEQISNPPNIPEAALLDPAQNAVTIMTVHGSKGLTKRVVILPDMSFRPDSDRNFSRICFDESKEPMFAVKITAPDKSSVMSPGFKDANNRAKEIRNHELKNLLYVAFTRARDLIITSASVGKNPEGWLKQMEPLIGNEILAIPYSDLSTAAQHTEQTARSTPSAEILSNALGSLLPAPEPLQLKRLPATKLAKEQDEVELGIEKLHFTSMKKATAMGSLGHAVLEQLVLNDWNDSIENWLGQLREEFGITKNEANTLVERLERTKALMMELTADMDEVRPEQPFVLHHEDKLIDGSIDLLCRTGNEFSIFDYKFTEADENTVANQYRGQMKIYRLAAEKLHPYAGEANTQLILVSSTATKAVTLDF